MRQVLFKQGKVVVEEVPAPGYGANDVLVENLFSLISSGTELSSAGVTPGYSCCGRVIKVGKNIGDVKKGDIVACAGANIASHAEFVAVPRNLVAAVPDGVSFEDACSATVGAIALQGVRQADLRVGESVVPNNQPDSFSKRSKSNWH
jgi:NADPH:quinone reductase-like Zn-dependent oxidoreductase